ncbi:MAG: zinc finger domain-containing protein [Methermicoccaceae archaeon]
MVKAESADYCNSCGVALIVPGFTRFPCPSCGETIGRCIKCRETGVKYICPKCGFQGP